MDKKREHEGGSDKQQELKGREVSDKIPYIFCKSHMFFYKPFYNENDNSFKYHRQ